MLNKIIKYILNNKDKIKFYNLSYREYVCLYDKYIIYIYPFVYKIDYIDDRYNKELYRYHHIDFKDKKIKYDPCDIYELVSGYTIHSYPITIDNFNYPSDYFLENTKMFREKLFKFKRQLKINKIL